MCYHRAGILGSRLRREAENQEREERKPLVRSEDWDYILFSDAVGPMEVLETQPRAKLMDSWDEIMDLLKQIYRDQKTQGGGIPICGDCLSERRRDRRTVLVSMVSLRLNLAPLRKLNSSQGCYYFH